ncbi:carboxylating nicotinate-nucleotide diphosphorylase [Sporosarcina siberiensis]|uniref:nicotinate-nucleotide diphosphorylase (carboxylating) n=1 Tax=Sporosarcina siberiensis TaxID=1365606 RepID=A0ABW4SHP7_9BACL
MNDIKLKSMLEQFFIEDIGDGDLSSMTLFPEEVLGEMVFVAKMDGVFCGNKVIQLGTSIVDPFTKVICHLRDGEYIRKGEEIATFQGSVQSLLKSERVLLNIIQRMSGIASETNDVVQRVKGTTTKICDTRKTMPGLRMLDKYAVRMGGGSNHRSGLYDAVMLKDNHLAFAGSISKAVETIKKNIGHTVKIEVEIESYEQLKEAVEAKVDIIMFDNCTPKQIKEWKVIVPNSIITEASGNITKETIYDYANAGIDFISLGYLTHSVQAFDISAVVSIN